MDQSAATPQGSVWVPAKARPVPACRWCLMCLLARPLLQRKPPFLLTEGHRGSPALVQGTGPGPSEGPCPVPFIPAHAPLTSIYKPYAPISHGYLPVPPPPLESKRDQGRSPCRSRPWRDPSAQDSASPMGVLPKCNGKRPSVSGESPLSSPRNTEHVSSRGFRSGFIHPEASRGHLRRLERVKYTACDQPVPEELAGKFHKARGYF